MTALADRNIEPLTKTSKSPTTTEIKELLSEISSWQVNYSETGKFYYLERKYKCAAYPDVILFHNKVAELAEAVQHHPEMVTEYYFLTVKWWSHSVGGLHLNDFVMAAKCDQIYNTV